MYKRILCFLLLVIIVSTCGFKAYPVTIPTETIFPLSNVPRENASIILRHKTLIIQGLPKSEKYNYVLIKLTGNQGVLPTQKRKNVRKEAHDVIFNLRDIPNGSYFIEIYSAPKKYSAYSLYIRSVQIEVSDYSLEFIEPLALAENIETFNANKQDSETLAQYLKPSERVQSDNPHIIKYAKTITEGFPNDYDKAIAINRWVCDNIWYDYDELQSGVYNNKTAVDTLALRRGVCIDYASVTAALLRASGIPAKLVTGYVLNISAQERWDEEIITSNKGNHVWNEAYIDGRWIIIDTSYDSNNSYKNQEFSIGTGMTNRKYFDVTIELMSVDHYILPREFDPLGFD